MPPLSRLDLPGVIASIRTLYCVIEQPPAAPWRPPAWLIDQYRKTTAGEEALTEYKESWVVREGHYWLIGEAARAVLDRLTPPNHHAGEDCPEINDSGLDLSHKAALLGLRRSLMGFGLGHELAGNRSARLEMLHYLESVLEALGSTAGPFDLDKFLIDGLLIDAHAAESNRHVSLAWEQRDAARRALSRLVDHTKESRLRDTLDAPDAAPSYLGEWTARIMDYARALAGFPDPAGRLARFGAALDSDAERCALRVLSAASGADGPDRAVHGLLASVWQSRVNTFAVNQALHRICEALLGPAPGAWADRGAEAADARRVEAGAGEGKRAKGSGADTRPAEVEQAEGTGTRRDLGGAECAEGTDKSKRAGGRRPLDESNPLKFQVYDRIRREHRQGEEYTETQS
jgi:hypothetical protein